MTESAFETLQVGDLLPPYTTAPITRTTLALYAGASGDHNPVHIDSDYARSVGVGDVFSHGMLIMAYLGRLLTAVVPQSAIRSFGVRFISLTRVHESITCSGKVMEQFEQKGEQLVRLELTAANQDGEVKLTGQAVVAILPKQETKI